MQKVDGIGNSGSGFGGCGSREERKRVIECEALRYS